MTDLVGKYLGRYHLTERLGEGGMATVYKAQDTRLERDVAIKIIRSAAFPMEALDGVLKRFEREAKALAKLSHPNIVKVHDYGEHDGSPYLVMEYLPGGTLKKLIGKPMNWQKAIQLLIPVGRGVAYAHQRGILHRDIKPANILLNEDGDPMLSDFGIAKLFEGEQTTALTGSGMAIGTPEYMAPEQWTGTTSQQSDLYSLGIVLYEMLVGRKPYVGDTPASILIKQATEPLPSPRKFVPDLPEALEQVLVNVLAKEPGDRYKDVQEFIRELERVQVAVTTARGETFLAKEEVPSTKPSPRITGKEAPQDDAATIREDVSPSLRNLTVQRTPVIKPLSPVEDGRTVHAHQVEPQKRDEQLSANPVSRIPFRIKISRKGFGFLAGGIFILIALWLGVSQLGTRVTQSPVTTEQVTSAFSLTPQPITETPTPEATVTPDSTLTSIPLEPIASAGFQKIMFLGSKIVKNDTYMLDNPVSLYMYDLTSGELNVQTQDLLDAGFHEWSYAIGKILYSTGSRIDLGDIFIYDLNTNEQKNLTENLGQYDSPVLSPDGKKLSFLSFTGTFTGKNDITTSFYVMGTDGKDKERLLYFNGFEMLGCPTWSPDNQHIAYVFGYDIFIIGLDGARPINVTRNGQVRNCADYSPVKADEIAVILRPEPGKPQDIFLINTTDLSRRQLTDGLIPVGEDDGGGFLWSPDGNTIAVIFRPEPGKPRDIFLINTTDLSRRQLTDGLIPVGEDDSGFSWSPDGDTIAVFVGEQLSIIDVATGSYTRTVLPKPGDLQVPMDFPNYRFMSWLPNSHTFLFTSDNEIYTIESDGSNFTHHVIDNTLFKHDVFWLDQ